MKWTISTVLLLIILAFTASVCDAQIRPQVTGDDSTQFAMPFMMDVGFGWVLVNNSKFLNDRSVSFQAYWDGKSNVSHNAGLVQYFADESTINEVYNVNNTRRMDTIKHSMGNIMFNKCWGFSFADGLDKQLLGVSLGTKSISSHIISNDQYLDSSSLQWTNEYNNPLNGNPQSSNEFRYIQSYLSIGLRYAYRIIFYDRFLFVGLIPSANCRYHIPINQKTYTSSSHTNNGESYLKDIKRKAHFDMGCNVFLCMGLNF